MLSFDLQLNLIIEISFGCDQYILITSKGKNQHLDLLFLSTNILLLT